MKFKIIVTCLLTVIFKHIYPQSYVVGQQTINIGTNQVGQLSSYVPIDLIAGRMNLTPEVGIKINSGFYTTNSCLGNNADLDNIQYISRTGKNWHRDNKAHNSVLFNSTDLFVIDGNRLELVEGVYGEINSKYRIENDVFALIEFKGTHFVIKTKSGETLLLGDYNNSSLNAKNYNNKTLKYYIFRRYDRHGNFINYDYENANGEIYLKTISYTGFDNTIFNTFSPSEIVTAIPDFTINFEYEDKLVNNKYFVNGYEFNASKLLTAIQIKSGSNIYRNYNLEYDLTNNSNYLVKIKKSDKNNNQVYPIEIVNENIKSTTDLNEFYDRIHQTNSGWYRNNLTDKFVKQGDFNNDGIKEIVNIRQSEHFGINYIERIDICNVEKEDNKYLTDAILKYNINSNTSRVINLLIQDLDGDGDDDILLHSGGFAHASYGYSTTEFQNFYHALISERDNSNQLKFKFVEAFFKGRIIPYVTNVQPAYRQPFDQFYTSIELADIDGDGLVDLIERDHYSSNSHSKFYYSLQADRNILNNHNNLFLEVNGLKDFKILDFNGNGKSDFVQLFHNGLVSFIEFRNDFSGLDVLYQETDYLSFQHVQFGDVNGDNLTDLLYFDKNININDWVVAISTGNNLIKQNLNIKYNGTGFEPTSTYQLYFNDYDGDGLCDIAEFKRNDNCNLYRSKGTLGFEKEIIFNSTHDISKEFKVDINNSINTQYGFVKPLNILGKYGTQLAIKLNTKIYHLIDFSKNIKTVSEIKNNAISYSIVYENLLTSNNYFIENIKLNNQNIIKKNNLLIVTNIKKYVNNNLQRSSFYYYKNFIYNRHGYGFLGFLENAQRDIIPADNNNSTEILTITKYVIANLKKGKLNLIEKQKFIEQSNSNNIPNANQFPVGNFNNLVNKEVYVYKTLFPTSVNNNIVFNYVSFSYNYDYLNNIIIEKCFEYDNNGNAILVTTTNNLISNINNKPPYKSSVYTSYITKNTWIPSSPNNIYTIQVRLNSDNTTYQNATKNENVLTYNNIGNVTSNHMFVGTPNYLKTMYEYDIFGHVIESGVNSSLSSNIFKKKSKWFFDHYGNLISFTDMLGRRTIYTYNSFRQKTSETNYLNKTISYTPDNWGRITSIYQPNGIIINKNYLWETSQSGSWSIYTETGANNTQPTLDVEYYNANNQIIKLTSLSNDNSENIKEFAYNNFGLVTNETNLYNLSKNVPRINYYYNYDIYGRLLTKKLENTIIESISYNLNQKTVLDGKNRGKTITLDATGNVNNVVDNGGTINYLYNSNGNNTKINYNGTSIEYTFDNKSQLLSKSDPNSGLISYTYNSYGDVLTINQNNIHTTTNTYDDYGRLTIKSVGNFIYEYSYQNDTNLNGCGQLVSEQMLENNLVKHRIEYDYNSFDQLVLTNEIASNSTVTTSYEYDIYNRLIEKKYTDFDLIYTYVAPYSNMINKVEILKNGNKRNIYELIDDFPGNNVKSFKFGNNFVTNYNFNPSNGFLNSITSINSSNSTTANNISYEFEVETNNLLSKRFVDAAVNLDITESYNYDNLNRLTASNLGNSSFIINYETNGNISNKYDAGNYSGYLTAKPNALEEHIYNAQANINITPVKIEQNQYSIYNHNNKITSLSQGDNIMNIEYGVHNQRINTQILENNVEIENISYISTADMEIKNNQKIHYIKLGDFPIATYKSDLDELSYLHLDNLGSLVCITNENGDIVEKFNYDAWGRLRDPLTLDYVTSNPFNNQIFRGYTFHEHIEYFNIINMNGRMYDPVTARFFSPDPLLQDPTNTQNLNRYTYVLNNPLKYTDPSGYAYYGYGGANASSAGVMQNRCLISQQIEDFETRRKAFLSNQWHDVTLFDLIGDRGGAVSAQHASGSTSFFGFTSLSDNSPQAFVQNYFAFRSALSFANQEYYWDLKIRGSIMLKEVVCEATSVNAQGGGGTPDWVNNTIGAASAITGFFQAGYLNDANQTFKYAQRINGKVRSASTITRANRISSLSTAKSLSRVGGGLTFLAAGATVYDGLTGESGWQNHHTADLIVTGAIYGTAAAFPVVGWVAGGLYFAADLTTQYYTGKSITQNLFDQ